MLTSLLGFLGGLGIFLYGTNILSSSLQKIGALKMRTYLSSITDTRIKAVLSGIIATFLLQSSTVTNIIVVGLVGSAVISLAQAFGIVLGASIGTTLTVQILTFDVAKYASVFIFLGVIFSVFVKNQLWRNIGHILLSIGFIFFGIGLITSSLEPLSKNERILQLLVNLSDNPLLFTFIALVLTALMHSSAAVIIIGIAFISSGVLTLPAILPLVLGANIGSTIPVVISSLTSRLEGKKLAIFYFLIKTVGVLITLPLLYWITDYVQMLPGTPERQVAHFHTLFNIAIVILFLPFLHGIALLFQRIFPVKTLDTTFKVHLDDALLKVPEEALISSKGEIIRLAEMVQENMIKQLRSFTDGTISADEIYNVERMIDESYVAIQQYLLKLGQQDLTNTQSTLEVKLLNILNDIEHIGDMVVRFMNKSEQIKEKNILLSESDKDQLNKLLYYIDKTFDNSLKAFKSDDLEIAKTNIQLQSEINQFEKDIKFEHFNSLISKQQYNPDISAVYLDTVNQLFQVYHHSMNISRTVLGLI